MKRKYFFKAFIHRLRLDEYYEMVGEIFDNFKGIILTEEYLNKVIANLQRHLEALDVIVERRKFHDNSTVIQDKADERHRMLRSIVSVTNGMKDADTEEKREAATVVYSFIRKERRAFGRRRIKSQSGLVRRMAAEAREDSNLEEALEILGLDGVFERLQYLTSRIVALSVQRVKEKNRLADMAEELRRKSYKDLVIVLDTFENHANLPSEEQNTYHEICMDISGIMKSHEVAFLLRTGQLEEIEDAEGEPEASDDPQQTDPNADAGKDSNEKES